MDGGAVVVGDAAAGLSGRVLIGAMEPETMADYVGPGDVVVIGDRVRGQHVSVERAAACLLVTGGHAPTAKITVIARDDGTAIVVSPPNTYSVARRINVSIPASALMDPKPLVVRSDDLLADVRANLISSAHRAALVTDEDGTLLGIISRTDLARAGRRPVVLVDHSESSQSADGIHEAQVVAIIDHPGRAMWSPRTPSP